MIAVWVGLALAHGVGADQVVLDATTDRVVLVATPRVEALPFADDDFDGELSVAEINRHRGALERALDDMVRWADQDGMHGELLLSDIVLPERHPGDPATVRLYRTYQLTRPPEGLLVELTGFGTRPVTVRTRTSGGSDTQTVPGAHGIVRVGRAPLAVRPAPGQAAVSWLVWLAIAAAISSVVLITAARRWG